MFESIRVQIVNRSDHRIDTLTVAFDPSYIANFSGVGFTPSATRACEVSVVDVGAGEARVVTADLQAEKYGRHEGWIQATSGSADTARVTIHTTISRDHGGSQAGTSDDSTMV